MIVYLQANIRLQCYLGRIDHEKQRYTASPFPGDEQEGQHEQKNRDNPQEIMNFETFKYEFKEIPNRYHDYDLYSMFRSQVNRMTVVVKTSSLHLGESLYFITIPVSYNSAIRDERKIQFFLFYLTILQDG